MLEIEVFPRRHAPEPELYLYLTSVLPAGMYQSPSLPLMRLAAPPPLFYTFNSLRGRADEGLVPPASSDSSALPNCVVYQKTSRSKNALSLLTCGLPFHRKYYLDFLT